MVEPDLLIGLFSSHGHNAKTVLQEVAEAAEAWIFLCCLCYLL
jgi:hypothetical protein